MQSVVTNLIVAIALAYVAWLFSPVAARHWLIARIARFAPRGLRIRFDRAQAKSASTGCSTCQGCETDAKAATTVKPIRLHRS